ncbi:MAG TPA: ABC transporter ATP-binding protein [Patescibacteria group bacterium]|nr:ABC transporter ATP-binding protein [Patescibacteria group bacterium]
MNKVIEIRNVTRSFEQGGHKLNILNGVSLDIARGEVVALLGPSGSGKTTLLQIAGLLENPTSGDVIINGQRVESEADEYRTTLRRTQIGFVYQFHHLLSDFTALENLLLPQLVAGVSANDATLRAKELLEKVGLSHRADHFPSQMSGGEQQRVAIARGLVNKPALLLADEPTGNLDPKTAESVFQMLMETISALQIGALIVTHNHELARRMNRVLELKEGRV